MKSKKLRVPIFAAILSLLTISQVFAIPLDLTTFTAEDGAVVSGGGGASSPSLKAIPLTPGFTFMTPLFS